jgi:hypothetical protein
MAGTTMMMGGVMRMGTCSSVPLVHDQSYRWCMNIVSTCSDSSDGFEFVNVQGVATIGQVGFLEVTDSSDIVSRDRFVLQTSAYATAEYAVLCPGSV